MTELEKAARMALEASTKAVTAMRGIYGGWRCESAIKACEDAAAALTQALATTEPVKPLFAAKVAAQKWAELQEQGHRMQTIWFDGGPGGAGTIDPWGNVTWTKTEPATTEPEWETSPMDGEQWETSPMSATTERKGEPFGQVTVKHPVRPFHAPLYTFYPWPQPPYLDNVHECHTVYTSPQAPEDVQRDAERYRKIRQGSAWPCAFASHDAPEPLTGDDLDAAADAARKGE